MQVQAESKEHATLPWNHSTNVDTLTCDLHKFASGSFQTQHKRTGGLQLCKQEYLHEEKKVLEIDDDILLKRTHVNQSESNDKAEISV